MPRIAVKDGLTREVTLTEADEGEPLVESCTIKYRPATTAVAMAFDYDFYHASSGEKRAALLIDLIVGHVIGWDFADEDGNPLSPTDRKAVSRIPLQYLTAMRHSIVKSAFEVGKLLGN